MHTGSLVKSGTVLAAVLILGGCMSARAPTYVEAASQDLAAAPLEAENSLTTASTDKRSIFSSPNTSVAHRQKLGDSYASQVLKRSKRSSDTKMEEYLQRLVNRLGRHIDGDHFAYRIYLLDDSTPNAFTTGGGHLFVTTGLVSKLRTEGQLAAVVAHEMAHNAAAHVVKGAHGQEIVQRTAEFSENVMHQRWGVPWLGNSIEFLVLTGVNKYTRKQEDEADSEGLHAMVAAGYDPHEAANAVKSLSAHSKDQSEIQNFFFGRHSTAKARIWRFGNLIKAYYPKLDTAMMIRSSEEYDGLASKYWYAAPQKAAELTVEE